MLKKIFLLIKFSITTMAWGYIYFHAMRFLFLKFWNFDIVYLENWNIIAEFWQGGGIIQTSKDILFMTSIILSLPLGLYILKKSLSFKYTSLITKPIEIYDRYILNKYDGNSSRLVLKNLSTKAEKVSLEDLIETKIKEKEKEDNKDKNLKADEIRLNIQSKIKNKK
ncbi:MAG: hypothetical protein PHE89_05935 [Alphaproteobacteria bacterium]|nr:hypothetical protein [Alphaproteobacteria bacterium]